MVATFTQTAAMHGYPASTLTDNGMVYTTRFSNGLAAGRHSRNGFETLLHDLDIVQKNSRPNHPTTCGKVERVQQTLKKWLRAQPDQPATVADLQALLDGFVGTYNHHRPYRSLPQPSDPSHGLQRTPQESVPSPDRTTENHHRVRADKVDGSGCVTLRVNGRLHHIGVGRTHARTHVLLLVEDLTVRIIDAATGELLRDLVIDPTRDYQGTGRPPGPAPKKKVKTEPTIVGPAYADVLRHHSHDHGDVEPTTTETSNPRPGVLARSPTVCPGPVPGTLNTVEQRHKKGSPCETLRPQDRRQHDRAPSRPLSLHLPPVL